MTRRLPWITALVAMWLLVPYPLGMLLFALLAVVCGQREMARASGH